MALEYSEVMAAGAMFSTAAELKKASESTEALGEWIINAAKKVADNVEFGSSRNEFLGFMEPTPAAFKEAAVGISAALAIKGWLGSSHGQGNDAVAQKVFLTGNVWPKEVEKFRIKAYGFDDYNSSDFIVKTADKKYFGVSLKKKPKKNSADPTLINKAFDTVLNGNQFDKIKEEITELRTEYFAGLVRQANEDGILFIKDINRQTDKELFEAKKRDKKIFDRAYINIKGSISGGYGNDKAPDAMRKFVNSDLAKTNNVLFKRLTQYMNDNADLFAKTLINLVLKVKLYDELSANKKLKDFTFGFALVTGIGEIARGKPNVSTGKAIDLHTILCGLSDLEANKKPYKIAVDFEKKAEANAAKIFFKLSKAGVNILDMELRYKGSFTSQPQFFATVTKEFQTILTEKCLVPNPDGYT
tara:strand:- start:1037 stop:2284 length:1248 start_codon:yes stop_codon:yes gene_type:complete